MKRTQVLLTEEQQQTIRRIAAAESTSAGTVIRRLIDRGLSDTEADRLRAGAEKLRNHYQSQEDPSFGEVEPWAADETR
jgi:nucleoside diphosphate kinase